MNLSFDAVLDNHETRELFRKHLQNAITTEGLSLFEAVEKYSLQRSDINRFKSALKIVQTYIGSGATNEVNISEESRIILQATLVVCSPKDCPRGLFDKIVVDVVCNMKQDSFPRFLQSKELTKFLREKEIQLGAKYQDYIAELSLFDPHNIPQHEKLNTISCTIEESHEGVSAPKISLDDPKDLLSDEELYAMCKAMKEPYNGIPVGDRKVTFKTHSKCFRASEIITWLSSYQNVSRKEAVLYFTTVQNRKRPFVRVNKKKELSFKDSDNVLYRFRERKHVVLLGGGFANVVAARKLEEEYDVTLVDPKAEFECIPSFPLLVSDPGRISKIQHDYRACLKHTRVITDWVAQVTPKRVYLSGKIKHDSEIVKRDESTEPEETLPYIEFDHLIVGTGGVKADRFKIVQGVENCAVVSPYEWRTVVDGHFDIQNAKHIVVAGGGSMAVEIASEVLHYNSNIKVTMIVSGPALMHLFDKSVAETCATKLAKFKNLRILTDSEVTLVEGRTVFYRNKIHGKSDSMDTDVIMVCTGTRPNSGILRKYMPHALRTSDGGVLVNKSFQVKKEGDEYYTNIFAVGDVTAINEVKLANLAMHHGRVIADVINAIECGVITSKLPQYKMLIEPLTISFGPDSALLVLNGKVIANNMIVREIKYKLETKVEFVLKRNKRFLVVV